MRASLAGAALIGSLTLAGCGGGTTANSPAPPQPASTAASTPAPSPSPSATVAPVRTPGASATRASATDAAVITKLVQTVDVTADYLHVVCDQAFTSDFVTMAYGSMDTCRHSQDGNGPGSNATSVSVDDVKVGGDVASANVTDHGGSASGTTGTWYFLRSAGIWRVSDLGVDYLRSNFKLTLAQHKDGGATDAFADTAYRNCFATTFLGLPDDQFVAQDFATQSGRSALGALVAPCDAKASGGASPFRTAFDAQFRQTLLQEKAPTEVVNCAVVAMVRNISDTDLTDAILDAPAAGSTAVTNLNALEKEALRGCVSDASMPPM